MMRYLQHDMLKRNSLTHFDCWASAFGETTTAIELAPEGTGYRARTRFAKFFNLPELMNLFREAADIKTADQLNLPTPTAVYHTEVTQPTALQQQKDNAGAAILEAFKDAKGLEPVPIGSYRGFAMSLTVENFGKDFILTLKGRMSHRVELGKDARGNLVRIDNALAQMPERYKTVQGRLEAAGRPDGRAADHASCAAFQQGLEVCFNKMVLVFQSAHGHDFFTAFRLRTESQNRCDCAGVCGAICGGDWCGATTVAA